MQRNQNPHPLLLRMENGTATMENSLSISQNFKQAFSTTQKFNFGVLL